MLLTKSTLSLRTALLAIIISFVSISNAHAGRFVIPSDDDVLVTINKGIENTALNPDDIKILVWNLYKGDKDSFSVDYKKLIRDQDILLLQEVITSPQMKAEFFQDWERTYYIATSFKDKKRNYARTGVATASSYMPTHVDWQRSYYREPIIKTPKMVSLASFDIAGTDEDLLTANIHAINFVSTKKLKHMVNEVAKVIAKHKGPVVFGGDFNTWSKKKLKMVHSLLGRIGMKPVSFPNDRRMRTFGNILDHIFIKGLKVKRSHVYGNIEGSDHKAMAVELQLP